MFYYLSIFKKKEKTTRFKLKKEGKKLPKKRERERRPHPEVSVLTIAFTVVSVGRGIRLEREPTSASGYTRVVTL